MFIKKRNVYNLIIKPIETENILKLIRFHETFPRLFLYHKYYYEQTH